jgi:hypothetical protein
MPSELLSHRHRGEWRPGRQSLGLIIGDRHLWRQSLHLLSAEQHFHLVLR